MTPLLVWLTLLAVVAAIELTARFGLPFDLDRVLAVEAVLFPLAGAACVALMRRWPRERGTVRTLQLLVAAAFFLGGIRSFVWVATGSVMLANVKAGVAGLAAWIWFRWRRNRGGSVLTACLLAASLGACGDAVGPESARVGDLEVELTLSADEVRLHESFEARVVVRNTGDEDVTLVSPCSALAFVGIHRAAERLRVRGTDKACFLSVTHWEIPAGGEVSRTWTVTAETPEGDPVPRGLYVFRVDFEVDLPDLETRVRVL